MRRKIVLEYGANKKLIARFGVSVKTVNNALNYRHESKLAEKIRNALDEGTFEAFRREYSEKLARRI